MFPNNANEMADIATSTGVCSYVQKHVIDALEGFSRFLARPFHQIFAGHD